MSSSTSVDAPAGDLHCIVSEPSSKKVAAPLAAPWGVGLFVFCLAANLVQGSAGWDRPITDFIAFRQTQTALSAAFMLGHRYAIVYETPVLGPPWPIPYEFPLYQWIVAALATETGWTVDHCGRLVSRTFFLLTLLPLYRILARLGVAVAERYVVLALFLISPYFTFWSRTVLIESTALFLAACYLSGVLAWREKPRPGALVAAVLSGTLCGLVKATTLAGFALLSIFLVLEAVSRRRQSNSDTGRHGWRWTGWALLVLVPLVNAVGWTAFADHVKAQNPFGKHLTTEALAEWNLGTWEQRLDPAVWAVMLQRVPLAVPHPGYFIPDGSAVGSLILMAVCLWAVCWRRRWRLAVAACLLVYFALPAVFTNLYWFHEYYHFANHPLLVGAVGLALAALLEAGGWLRALALACAMGIIVLGVLIHADYYYPTQVNGEAASLGACQVVREQTDPEDVIVVLGCDWSSEVPYYSRRRALALPESWKESVRLEALAQYLKPLRGYRLGALVVHGPENYRDWFPTIDAALATCGVRRVKAYGSNAYEVYLLRPRKAARN